MILYIKHKDIDKKRWDKCLSEAAHGKVYGYSWYLDAFCEWDAIVYKDYEGGFPIPIRAIGPFRKIYQPPFVQSCDWMGAALSKEVRRALWEELLKRSDHIHLNSYVDFAMVIGKLRTNITLPLNQSYPELQQGYAKDLSKNLRKAERKALKVIDGNIDNTITLYRQAYGDLNPHLKTHHYKALEKLVAERSNTGDFIIKDVLFEGRVLASLLFVCGKGRMHYILGAPNEEGRKLNALSVALDHMVQQFSGQAYILDFEGSSIPSVARFFKSFGGREIVFHEYNVIHNPWLKRAHRMLK